MVVSEDQSTLVDYFVVAGYDVATGLVIENGSDGCFPDGNSVPADAFRPPLQRSFVAQILEYFPKKRSSYPFSPEVIHLCMPKGLRFFTEKNVPHSSEIHTFANIREDGSRVNGTCITFYEEVVDISLCEAMVGLQQQLVRQQMAMEREVPRGHLPPGTVSGGTHTLPRRRNHIVNKRISYYDASSHGTLYMSKCLCLLTRLPMVAASSSLLEVLHRVVSTQQRLPLPVESYIYWMLNEVPLPLPNTTLNVRFLEQVVVLQRPSEKELPFYDYCLSQLFELIPIEKFMKIFTAFLLEHQILICSRVLHRLMLVCESLCALAFPFRWQLAYVPILPAAQLKFLEAPVPYVMGLCYDDVLPDFLFESNVCVLDVDSGRAEVPEELPLFPQQRAVIAEIRGALEKYSSSLNGKAEVRNESEEARSNTLRLSRSFDDLDDLFAPKALPSHFDSILDSSSPFARVQEIARRVGVNVNVDSIKQELNDCSSCIQSASSKKYFQEMRLNNMIRESLSERMARMFFSYEQFVLYPLEGEEGEGRESMVAFDKAAFLSDQPDSHLPFLAAFLETQMFTSFVDAKLLLNVSRDENVLLFDTRISSLRHSQGPTEDVLPPFAKFGVAEVSDAFTDSDSLIGTRERGVHFVVPQPHPLACPEVSSRGVGGGRWPSLLAEALDFSHEASPVRSPWKQRYRVRPAAHEVARPLSICSAAGISVDSPAKLELHNQKFVEQLLRDAKSRTKRLLVEKMGKEAVELGHCAGVSGVEENTMVAGLCHLLERVFAHGLVKKQGKSALWSFVMKREDCEKLTSANRSSSTSILAPARPLLFRRTTSNMTMSPPLPRCPRPPQAASHAESHSRPPPSRDSSVSALLAELNEGASGSEAPAWSRSLLRAANALAAKIDEASSGSGGVLASAIGRLNQPLATMKKSCSVSDFTSPSWSSTEEEVREEVSESEGSGTLDRKRRGREESGTRRRSQSRRNSPESHLIVLPPLPTSLSYDLKNVVRMNELKTELGYARAFVRLSLERKLLHAHLASLLSNSQLLVQSYKPYAFVRCEEEREQFLMYIMSLNAAQFRCFTNTFNKTKMEYQVVVVSSSSWGRQGRLPALWLIVEGVFCSTPRINLSHTSPFFKFDHKNLGVLSTLRIGHSSSQKPSKWFLDYVLVRNEVTGQKYRFPCGRWFGRGVEDGSLERLLVAEPVTQDDSSLSHTDSSFPVSSPSLGRTSRANSTHSRSQTPRRDRSPSTGRVLLSSPKLSAAEVEELVAEAVNALVRHLHADPSRQSRAELAHLLCGDGGLVQAIEAAFRCRRNDRWTTRFFGSLYPWDYIEKVSVWMHELSRRLEWRQLSTQKQALIRHALQLVRRILESGQLGKEGRFHVFVLLSLRDHTLCAFMQLMAWTPMTTDMYEESSVLRSPDLLSRFSKLLDSLNEFTFNIDSSLTYGIV